MKKLLLILLFVALFFGCNYIENNKSTDKLEDLSTTILDSTSKAGDLKIDSINESQIERDNPEVIKFVKQFYSSLELSAEENQKAYVEGGVIFDLSEFTSLIHENANYNEERVNNLSGSYHSYYYIEYIGIRSITLKSDCIEVLANVLYGLYETGNFYNLELLKIINVNGSLKMMDWRDVGLYKMEKSGYEGMETYNETDFYHHIGSDFYLNKAEEDTL